MLLGRRDGPAFVDWCNLERSKRVKPFRCGDLDLDDCIRKAQQQQAARRRGSTSTNRRRVCNTANGARYARKEDAVLQALQIERATNNRQGAKSSRKPSSLPAAANPPPLPKRKRRTPNDSEDDVPQGFRRMRDLTEIGSDAAVFPDSTCCLPASASQMKRSRQSHHDSGKRKHPTLDQDQPCGMLRKKDRSRPLSELCNGDMWNGFKPNAQRADHDQQLMRMGTCSGSSSASSSLDTLADKSSSHPTALFKTDQAKGITRLPNDDLPRGDELGSIFKADRLHVDQPGALMKDPSWECSKQDPDSSKADLSSQCDGRNHKKKTISSVDQEGSNRAKSVLEREHCKSRVVKYKAPSNEGVLLEERLERSTVDKTAAPDDDKDLAILPNDLDRVDAVLQQCSESKHKHEEPSETTSNNSYCENVSVSSVAFELPPQHTDPAVASCHAVKATKTLQLNSALYDVELSVQGSSSSSNNKGRHVPLVSLMSRSSRRPVVGYPVSVEVLDVVYCPPASSIDDDHPSTSSANGLVKEQETAVPQCAMPSSHKGRAKARSRRKTSEDDMDKSWRPHNKNPVSSPRKMRRLSSFATSQRGGEDRKTLVGKFCGTAVACIPLRVVFSRINEALSYSAK